jgi:hypothetical protein
MTGEAYAQQLAQPVSADTAATTGLDLHAPATPPGAPLNTHLSVLGGHVDSDDPLSTRRAAAGIGPTWQIKTGATFHAAGGFELSANLVGRRGSSTPLFMTEPVGTDASIPIGDPLRTDTLWDTELRVRKPLLTRKDIQLSLIGDLFNVVNVNPSPSTTPQSPTLTSRAFRIGLMLGF